MERNHKVAFGILAAFAAYHYTQYRSLVHKHNMLCDVVGEAADREFQREIDARFCQIVDEYDD